MAPVPDSRCEYSRDQRSRFSTAAEKSRASDPDRSYYPWRYSDDSQGDEVRSGGISDQAFEDKDLLGAVQQALASDCRRVETEEVALRARCEMLTRREREVTGLVVSGLLIKQIASELGTSEITVEVHGAQVMT